MRKISADYIYSQEGCFEKNKCIILDDDGKILAIENTSDHDDLIYFSGALVPGFVNTHCHLELSHLKGKIEQKKGLICFIKTLQKFREERFEIVLDAINLAEKQMIENGIVAIGDISNSTHSFVQKTKKNLYYHTFLESFGFLPDRAVEIFEQTKKMGADLTKLDLPFSYVPHAPYSTSKVLMDLIFKNLNVCSIHNQENESENKLFLDGDGAFIDLMQYFGLDTSFWQPTKKSSLQSFVNIIPKEIPFIFVHNTFTNEHDIEELWLQP
jgi:aminodeoxyfutalosine deaminase